MGRKFKADKTHVQALHHMLIASAQRNASATSPALQWQIFVTVSVNIAVIIVCQFS